MLEAISIMPSSQSLNESGVRVLVGLLKVRPLESTKPSIMSVEKGRGHGAGTVTTAKEEKYHKNTNRTHECS